MIFNLVNFLLICVVIDPTCAMIDPVDAIDDPACVVVDLAECDNLVYPHHHNNQI